MPTFGAHMSVAGGLHHALEAAMNLDCDCLQIFTKSPNQWRSKDLTDSEVRQFKTVWATCEKPGPLIAHDAYLTNLGSPDPELWNKSIEAFAVQIRRAKKLGLAYLVMHPGAHMGSGEVAGVSRVTRGLDLAMEAAETESLNILLETTAGQGTTLGWRLEHLRDILASSVHSKNLGICLDTCHVHAAGYALDSADSAANLLDSIDNLIGLQRLHVIHVNDSKKPAGSRADRHEHLGKGTLSVTALGALLSDPRLAQKAMILETPKEDEDGQPMDPVNLKILRLLAAGKEITHPEEDLTRRTRSGGAHRSPTSKRRQSNKRYN